MSKGEGNKKGGGQGTVKNELPFLLTLLPRTLTHFDFSEKEAKEAEKRRQKEAYIKGNQAWLSEHKQYWIDKFEKKIAV